MNKNNTKIIYIIILKVPVVKFREPCKTIYMIKRGFSLHNITFLRREGAINGPKLKLNLKINNSLYIFKI
jgi:hypothetical protein